jgi:hypothetical protein
VSDEVQDDIPTGVRQNQEETQAEDAARVAAEKYAAATEAAIGQPNPQADAMRKALDAKAAQGKGDHMKPVRHPAQDAVDLDLDELNTLTVRLGGRKWRAIEPTIEVNKILSAAIPVISGDAATSDDAIAMLHAIYPQVREILRDPSTDEPPSREFVERHLSGRNFGRLMEKLTEDAQEGNPAAG